MILPHPGHPVPSSMEALRAYFSLSDPCVLPRTATMKKAICLQVPAVSEEWRGCARGESCGTSWDSTLSRNRASLLWKGKKDLEKEWGWRQNSESSFFF